MTSRGLRELFSGYVSRWLSLSLLFGSDRVWKNMLVRAETSGCLQKNDALRGCS